RATHYDVYLSLYRAFRAERWLARLSYKLVEVAMTYEVFDRILQVIALLGVMSVITVEAAVAPAVMFLSSSPHRVGGFEESFLSNLDEDLSPGRVERNVGEPGNDLFGSFRLLPLESGRWAPRGFGPRSLLSSPFSTTMASATTYWLALCSISGTIVGGRSMSDQKRREGLISIMNAWITNDGCVSGMTLISFVKWARYELRAHLSSISSRGGMRLLVSVER
ncbi:hypothetical protein B296_00051994, partial [Ensete ventricosum]